jgi:hypothetical protein
VYIHNQYPSFNLVDPKCFSIGADWNINPNEKIDTGSMMNVDLKSSLATFEGVLICKLQKEDDDTNRQPDLVYTLLSIAWKSEDYKKFHVLVQLIEHGETIRWDKIKAEEHCRRYTNQLGAYAGYIKDTWLLHDGTVLLTELELDFMQRDGILNITISEGIRDEHTKRPIWTSLKR